MSGYCWFVLFLGVHCYSVGVALALDGGGSCSSPSTHDFLLKELRFQYGYTNPEATFSSDNYPFLDCKCRDWEPSTCVEEVNEHAMVFPAVADAVVPVYNLPELTVEGSSRRPELTLSLEIISRIYRCNVTHWNDPAIVSANPGLGDILPATPIQVAARGDVSSTTGILKRGLAEEDPLFVDVSMGTESGAGIWPCADVGGNSGSLHFLNRSEGIASFVLSTPHSIGYVPRSTAVAFGTSMASLYQAGQAATMRASEESISTALNSIPMKHLDHRLAEEIPKSGWPLLSFSFVVLRTTNGTDVDSPEAKGTCEAMKETVRFWAWALFSTSAREIAANSGFSPLPKEVASRVIVDRLLTEVKCLGEAVIQLEELQQSIGFVVDVRGSVPASLQQQLSSLPQAYSAKRDALVDVHLEGESQQDCAGGLREGEWFRLSTCGEDSSTQDSEEDAYTRIPFALHPIVVVANIPGMSSLVLSLPLIQAILEGEVTRFNDSRLVALNPAMAGLDEPLLLAQTLEGREIRAMLARKSLNTNVGLPSRTNASERDSAVSDSIGERCGTTAEMGLCQAPSTIAAARFVDDHAFSVALLPSFAVDKGFDKLMASVLAETGEAVQLSKASLRACLPSIDAGNSVSCYPLHLRSTLTLWSDYKGKQAILATKAAQFWAWVMSDIHISAQLERIPRRLQFPYSDIADQLETQTVNGSTVVQDMSNESVDGRNVTAVTWLIVGTASSVFLCALSAAILIYRNRQLAYSVKRMRTELDDMEGLEWDSSNTPDVETPLGKAMDFLQKLGVENMKRKEVKEEARRLHTLMKCSANVQMPSALSTMVANGSKSQKDMPIAMKYMMGLQSRASNGYRSVRDSIGSRLSLGTRPSKMDYTTSGRSLLSSSQVIDVDGHLPGEIMHSGSEKNFEGMSLVKTSSWWDGDPASQAIGTMPEVEAVRGLDMVGLGQSFFCNVMHLRSLGVSTPLAYVTFNILQRSGLTQEMQLHQANLWRYLRYVEDTYVPKNPYHNAWHAADVTQRCAAIVAAMELPSGSSSRLYRLAVIISAAMHDAGHPGVDNNFMIKQEDDVARSFNDQHVLEMNSLQVCLHAIRERSEYNFLEGSLLEGKTNWYKFKNAVINIVLSTDMAQHFDIVAKFSTKVGVLDPKQDDYRTTLDDNMPLVMSMAIKAADIGHCASRWAAHQFWSKCLEQEFFAQGDRERSAGLPVSPMMNRRGTSCLAPSSQIGFFDFIIMPMFKSLAKAFPSTQPLATQASANYRRWKCLQKGGQELPPLEGVEWYEEAMKGSRMGNTLQDAEDIDVADRDTSIEICVAVQHIHGTGSLKDSSDAKPVRTGSERRSWEKLWRLGSNKASNKRLSKVSEER